MSVPSIDPGVRLHMSVPTGGLPRQPHPEAPGCPHTPCCPGADASDRDAARVIAAHHDQGWSLLCNKVVLFDDTGELLPDGRIVLPHRGTVRCWKA